MKTRTKNLGLMGLSIGIMLAVPKMVVAGLSDWLLWGGIACTGAAIICTFTPAAPLAPVLGGVEVIGIVGAVLTHPGVTGAPIAKTDFNLVEEKLMVAEFFVTDLALLELPTGNDAQYSPIFAQANIAINRCNIFRQHLEGGSNSTVIAADLFSLSNSISVLADQIEQSGLNITVSAHDMNTAIVSIESQGLPPFELDHLVRSGFSQNSIETFTNLHATSSPNGGGFSQPSTLANAVRNVANRFTDIAIDLLGQSDLVPADPVVEVILADPQ